MTKILMYSELTDVRSEGVTVRITQKVNDGPVGLVGRTVVMKIDDPDRAVKLALSILLEHVPAWCVKQDHVREVLQKLAKFAESSAPPGFLTGLSEMVSIKKGAR